jgi:hypothetical protein
MATHTIKCRTTPLRNKPLPFALAFASISMLSLPGDLGLCDWWTPAAK